MPISNTPQCRQRFMLLLREHRLAAGLRQSELAQRIGQPQSFVSKYESGERRIDVLELAQICEALGISIRDFLNRLDDEDWKPYETRS